MEKVVITGATGMIGKALCKKLHNHYNLVIITRDPDRAKNILGENHTFISWDDPFQLSKAVNNSFGIINLAGRNISDGKWTKRMKDEILKSRVEAGKHLTKAIVSCEKKPSVFIQASAIGYYTHDYEKEYNESSLCFNNSFLNDVCKKWESSSKEVIQYNVRHIIARIGVVMDKNKGAFPKIFVPFKYYVGGNLGNGKQWISWIHLDDVVNALVFLLEKNDSRGIYNLVSPEPLKYMHFTKIIAIISQKPAWLNIPAFLLKMIYGQMATETLLASQRVIPQRLITNGFQFTFSNVRYVLEDFLVKKNNMDLHNII